jgi:hypothetical protein
MIYDVFNGDADGICALHQLRLQEPVESTLITGVKRDVSLLRHVGAGRGDEVTVLDVAVEKNLDPLLEMLDRGAKVRWYDHHFPGALPNHANFSANIHMHADTCTSLLVDLVLEGAQRAWAVVGAFGDNLAETARRAATPLCLEAEELDMLRELGECLNYNAYGESIEDLHFHPADLYRAIKPYDEPFAFVWEANEFAILRAGYAADLAMAQAHGPQEARRSAAVYVLPDAAWARRVSGVYANNLANIHPNSAHALLTRSSRGHYVVSVRAPLANPEGADQLCRNFAGGGGRKAAAGINVLPEAEVDRFITAFFEAYPSA